MARMKAEDRRQQLLESAARCFARHGYRGTTTAMIAAEAGISEPIIYRHFRTKQALFIALIKKVADEVFDNWQSMTKETSKPLDKLRMLMFQNPATSDPNTARVYRILFHASTETAEPAIQKAICRHYQRYVQALGSLIAEAQQTGTIRDDLPGKWLAWQIIHAAVGFAMVRPLNIPGHATMPFAQGTIQLLVELLTRRPGSPTVPSQPQKAR
ncbi:MAG TPA: TetR/AcrR family transcriptional regulator [Phycisphaerae bacterium]|nr:TetR/AcrR family transcriptional regulator [Phycisphaerae bacterium]